MAHQSSLSARRGEEAYRRLAEAASEARLELVTSGWLGAHANFRFRCDKGHEFDRAAIVVLRGTTRCPQCEKEAARRRFYECLAARNITCLEADYLGPKIRHRLQCAQGHTWSVEGRKTLEGSGCRSCALAETARKNTRSDGLTRMQRVAAQRGGRCLADEYLGTLAYYEWECTEGHRWKATAATTLRGTWCAACFQTRHSRTMTDPDGLERLLAAAAARGGECLAKAYEGQHAKYRFRCAEGHEWVAAGNGILRGAWCGRCARKLSGEAQRDPEGLQRLRAAAEAQGGRLETQEYRGIAANYAFSCAKGHRWNTRGEHVLSGTWCRMCAGLRRRHTLETMQEIAHERGGRCLSPAYLGVKVALIWECDRGHVWEASPDSILNGGSWCRNCSILAKTKKPHLRLRYDFEGSG